MWADRLLFQTCTATLAVALTSSSWAQAPTALPAVGVNASPIVSELGCVLCHSGLGSSSPLRERTPDLSAAGLRYQSAYLFDYLQKPAKVRQHLGRARMPDFRLSPPKPWRLSLFLKRRTKSPGTGPNFPPVCGPH